MMLKKWTGIERLIAGFIPALLPAHYGGNCSMEPAGKIASPGAGELLDGSRPTWLIPAYLRQQRSGDRISRWS